MQNMLATINSWLLENASWARPLMVLAVCVLLLTGCATGGAGEAIPCPPLPMWGDEAISSLTDELGAFPEGFPMIERSILEYSMVRSQCGAD